MSLSAGALSLSKGDIRLTMNVYTHLPLANTARGVEALPSMGPTPPARNQGMTGRGGG